MYSSMGKKKSRDCPQCGKSFARPSNVTRHLKAVHKKDTEQQNNSVEDPVPENSPAKTTNTQKHDTVMHTPQEHSPQKHALQKHHVSTSTASMNAKTSEEIEAVVQPNSNKRKFLDAEIQTSSTPRKMKKDNEGNLYYYHD